MTIDRIAKEIEQRIKYLEFKIEKIQTEQRKLFYGMNNADYMMLPYDSPEMAKDEALDNKRRPMECELSKLRDMLYVYNNSVN